MTEQPWWWLAAGMVIGPSIYGFVRALLKRAPAPRAQMVVRALPWKNPRAGYRDSAQSSSLTPERQAVLDDAIAKLAALGVDVVVRDESAESEQPYEGTEEHTRLSEQLARGDRELAELQEALSRGARPPRQRYLPPTHPVLGVVHQPPVPPAHYVPRVGSDEELYEALGRSLRERYERVARMTRAPAARMVRVDIQTEVGLVPTAVHVTDCPCIECDDRRMVRHEDGITLRRS